MSNQKGGKGRKFGRNNRSPSMKGYDARRARNKSRRAAKAMRQNDLPALSVGQANAIQERRFRSGKTGYAKAVRRAYLTFCDGDFDRYHNALAALPVRWPEPKAQEDAA